MDFTLTFLGTGTSQGVPMVRCGCAVCRSGDSRDCRTRASVYLETPEAAWVIDTGPEFRVQCLREGVTRLDAALYTHAHSDHIMGFDDLRQFCVPDIWLPIYAGPETMADIQRDFSFAFRAENALPGYVHPDPRIVNGPFQLGATTVTPLPLLHGRAETNGYLFERDGRLRVAYLCDCKTAPEAVVQRIRGVEHLIVDAVRHRPHPTHLSVSEALELRERIQPRQTWLTHISHDLPHAETEAGLPEGVKLAWDGLKLEV